MPVNAQAVVNVQVNSAPFDEFMKEFQKYVALLGKTPAAWAQMSAAQKSMVMSFNQGIAALMAQNEMMRRAAQHAKDLSVHSEKTKSNWQGIVRWGKDHLKQILDIHAKLMKWGSILAGIMTGTGAASAWGLDKLAQWVRGGEIRGTQAGLKSGESRALQTQFGGPMGISTDSIAAAVTTAAERPGSEAYNAIVGGLGLDPEDLKGTDKVTKILDEIRKLGKAGWSASDIAEQLGGVGTGSMGLDAAKIRSILGMEEGEYQKSKVDVKKEAKELEIDPEAKKKWNEFLKALEHATERLKTIMANYLTPVLNLFTQNSQRWLDWLKKFMEDKDTQEFLEKLPGRVKYVMDELLKALTVVYKGLLWFGHFMGWLETKEEEDRRKKKEKNDQIQYDLYGQMPDIVVNDPNVGKFGTRRGQAHLPGNVPGALPTIESSGGSARGYAEGTDNVPETGTYKLHKGEIVIPARDAELLRRSGMEDWKRAISGIESGGNYGIMNTKGSGATGKYQVMPGNIAAWTREAIGHAMSQEEFRRSPYAQERVFEHIFGQYVSKFGNPIDAASAWFSGQPLTGNKAGPDAMGTSVPGYIRNFLQGLGGSGGRMSVDINDNTGGNVLLAASQMAFVGPLPAFPI